MIKKHSRRRKAPPVSDGRLTFTIVIDAQKIVVSYPALQRRWPGSGKFRDFVTMSGIPAYH